MLSGRETNYNDLASLSFCDRGQPDGARLPHRLLPCVGHPPSATGRTNTTYWSSPHTIHTIHTQFNTDQSLITFSITHSSTGSHRVASLCVQLYVFGAAAVTAWLIWGRICPPPAPLPRQAQHKTQPVCRGITPSGVTTTGTTLAHSTNTCVPLYHSYLWRTICTTTGGLGSSYWLQLWPQLHSWSPGIPAKYSRNYVCNRVLPLRCHSYCHTGCYYVQWFVVYSATWILRAMATGIHLRLQNCHHYPSALFDVNYVP